MILSFSKKWPWNNEPTHFKKKIKNGTKIHSIRVDQHERWREGMDIHFATGMRTPNYDNFQMGKCTGVQHIEVINRESLSGPEQMIRVDGFNLSIELAEELAINDGFDSLEQFFKWFDSDFEGRLIHWTDERY